MAPGEEEKAAEAKEIGGGKGKLIIIVFVALVVLVGFGRGAVLFLGGEEDDFANVPPRYEIEEGYRAENIYTSEEIGWTIEVPEGWIILSSKQADRYVDRGKELISQTIGEDIEMEGYMHLLHFKKDAFNHFQSSSEPFVVEYEGDWSENDHAVKEILLETYKNQGIKTRSSEIREKMIDGVIFHVYDVSLIAPDGKVILTQTMFSSLINGYDFGASITCNSDETCDAMLRAWKNSKFKKSHDQVE